MIRDKIISRDLQGGGEIVASGPPEDVVKAKRSHTGAFLAPVLKRRETKRRARTIDDLRGSLLGTVDRAGGGNK